MEFNSEIPHGMQEELSFIEARQAEAVAMSLENRKRYALALIAEGKIEGSRLTLHSICSSSIIRAQIAWGWHHDLATAKAHFAFPLADSLKPSFSEVCQLQQEGMQGLRPWNRNKVSLASEVERILCFIFADRIDEIISEYRFCDIPQFLHHTDYVHDFRAIFARQLIWLVQGKYSDIDENAYAKDHYFKQSSFLFGYHTLLFALARGDSTAFSAQLAVCSAVFQKRKRSKLLEIEWGYGPLAAQFGFDVVGTALCKLAVRRGLPFTEPEQRWYPKEFWQ